MKQITQKDINYLIKKQDATKLDEFLLKHPHFNINEMLWKKNATLYADEFDILLDNAKYLTGDTVNVLRKHGYKALCDDDKIISSFQSLLGHLKSANNIETYVSLIQSPDFLRLFKSGYSTATNYESSLKNNLFLSVAHELLYMYTSGTRRYNFIIATSELFKKNNIKLSRAVCGKFGVVSPLEGFFRGSGDLNMLSGLLDAIVLNDFIRLKPDENTSEIINKSYRIKNDQNAFKIAMGFLSTNKIFHDKFKYNGIETTVFDFLIANKFPLFFDVEKLSPSDKIVFNGELNWYFFNVFRRCLMGPLSIKNIYDKISLNYNESGADLFLIYFVNYAILKCDIKTFKELTAIKPIDEILKIIKQQNVEYALRMLRHCDHNLNLLEYAVANGSSRTIISELSNHLEITDVSRYLILDDISNSLNNHQPISSAKISWLIKNIKINDALINEPTFYNSIDKIDSSGSVGQVLHKPNMNTLRMCLENSRDVELKNVKLFKKLITQYKDKLDIAGGLEGKTLMELINLKDSPELTSLAEHLVINTDIKKKIKFSGVPKRKI